MGLGYLPGFPSSRKKLQPSEEVSSLRAWGKRALSGPSIRMARTPKRSCPGIDWVREEGRDNSPQDSSAPPPPKEAVWQRQIACVLRGPPLAQAGSCQLVAAGTGLSFAKQAAEGAPPLGSMEPINKHAARPGTAPAHGAGGCSDERRPGAKGPGWSGSRRTVCSGRGGDRGRPLVPRAWRRSASISRLVSPQPPFTAPGHRL